MDLLLPLHIFANLVWIGSIASIGWLLTAASRQADPAQGRVVAELANQLYRRLATPAFVLSFVTGVGRLSMAFSVFMHAHWFHGKLTLALVIIALHHVIGAKSKRAASEGVQAGARGAILAAAVVASAFAVALLVSLRTQLVP